MKIVVTPSITGVEQYVPELAHAYPQLDFVFCPERSLLLHELADAEILLGPVSREAVLAAPRLKWVQSTSTGVDNMLAIPELVARDVLLTGARGTHSACLAESVFGMILAFTRGIRESVMLQQEHRWNQLPLRGRLRELTGSALGLVGFGAMAHAIACRAQAFDMRVMAVDRYPARAPDGVALWGLERLDDLLRQSDYLVVTVPLHVTTRGMIGARELALMKPDAMLIGISRGGVIDQPALAAALREKRLAAAALDVFDPEPLPADSELWDLEGLLITPHIAGGTQLEAQHLIEIFRENLDRYLRGDFPLRNQVDKARGF